MFVLCVSMSMSEWGGGAGVWLCVCGRLIFWGCLTVLYVLLLWWVREWMATPKANSWCDFTFGDVSPIYCLWFDHIIGRLFYHSLISHGPFRLINDFKTGFKLRKPTLLKLKAASILSAPISRNGHGLTGGGATLLSRGHNFCLALWNSCETDVKRKLLRCTFCWYQ